MDMAASLCSPCSREALVQSIATIQREMGRLPTSDTSAFRRAYSKYNALLHELTPLLLSTERLVWNDRVSIPWAAPHYRSGIRLAQVLHRDGSARGPEA